MSFVAYKGYADNAVVVGVFDSIDAVKDALSRTLKDMPKLEINSDVIESQRSAYLDYVCTVDAWFYHPEYRDMYCHIITVCKFSDAINPQTIDLS